MSIMYHDGNRRLQDQFDSRRISDRLEEKLTRTAFTADDKALHRKRDLFLPRHGRRGRPARLLVQGRHAGLRARHRAIRARIPRLRRQRHVQEPRQYAGQSERRPAVHRPARASRSGCASTAPRRSTATTRCSAQTVGAQMIVRVQARAIFPNCPRYIPQLAVDRALDLPAARWLRSARAGVEELSGFQGSRAPAAADVSRLRRGHAKAGPNTPCPI